MNDWLEVVSHMVSHPNESAILAKTANIPLRGKWKDVLSVFTYVYRCTVTTDILYIHVPVEPTAALARDPRKCWDPLSDKVTQSKAYLLPLSSKSADLNTLVGLQATIPQRRAFLFDAGATVISKGTNR